MRQLRSLALAAVLAAGATAASADMMAACAPEIGQICADVREGRGRIAACLHAREGELGAACAAEMRAATSRGSRNVLVPSAVRTMLSPGFRAELPASCTADAGRLCPSVTPGDGRVFSCLYARNDRVASACSDAIQAVIDASG